MDCNLKFFFLNLSISSRTKKKKKKIWRKGNLREFPIFQINTPYMWHFVIFLFSANPTQNLKNRVHTSLSSSFQFFKLRASRIHSVDATWHTSDLRIRPKNRCRHTCCANIDVRALGSFSRKEWNSFYATCEKCHSLDSFSWPFVVSLWCACDVQSASVG